LKSSGTTSRPSSCPALGTPVTGGPILFGPKDALCRSYTKGSSCVSGGWRDQQFNQRTQQRFAPFSNIVNGHGSTSASSQVTRAGWLGSSWRQPASPQRGSLGSGGVALGRRPQLPRGVTCY
jgi:hypothetical protein